MSVGYHWRKALEAHSILKRERHPLHSDEERLAAAAFADKCVAFVVVAILLFALVEWVIR